MKRVVLLLWCSGLLACAAELANVHRVYLLPMAHGMDQYLANRLTNEHVFEVVTDPKLADAIFTDHLGEGFQARLEDISPSPAKPQPKAEPTEPADSAAPAEPAKPAETTTPKGPTSVVGMMGDTVNKLSNPAMSSSFGRGNGTVFLVWAKSREVVWSIYDPPKDTSGKTLDRTASAIVSRLSKDLNPKQK